MKRIVPVLDYVGEPTYPAVTRRGFLQGLAVGVGAASLALGAPSATAGGRVRVVLRLSRRIYLRGCDYQVDRIEGFTYDARLATFLGETKEAAATEAALLKLLDIATCEDVVDRKKLSALEGRLAAAAQAQYRARTKRTAGALTLTLFLTRQRLLPPGEAPAPSRP
jgi:hypothetical protein